MMSAMFMPSVRGESNWVRVRSSKTKTNWFSFTPSCSAICRRISLKESVCKRKLKEKQNVRIAQQLGASLGATMFMENRWIPDRERILTQMSRAGASPSSSSITISSSYEIFFKLASKRLSLLERNAGITQGVKHLHRSTYFSVVLTPLLLFVVARVLFTGGVIKSSSSSTFRELQF